MSNGHGPKDGIKFKAAVVGSSPEGVVTFKSDDPRVYDYFSEHMDYTVNVTATVVGDAGSTDDIPKVP